MASSQKRSKKHFAIAAAILFAAPFAYLIHWFLQEYGNCGYCGYILFSWIIMLALIVGIIWLLAAILIWLSNRNFESTGNGS